jgi:hypothetical protein
MTRQKLNGFIFLAIVTIASVTIHILTEYPYK